MPDTERASVPVRSRKPITQEIQFQAISRSSNTALTDAETLQLFTQLLDLKFDQKFAAFNRDLDEKEAATQSQLKKFKAESKASNSFTFKGNKVQYEFNVDGDISDLLVIGSVVE